MFNLFLKLPRWLTKLYRKAIAFSQKLFHPRGRLKRISRKLQHLSNTTNSSEKGAKKAEKLYFTAISLATKCSQPELTQIILNFDSTATNQQVLPKSDSKENTRSQTIIIKSAIEFLLKPIPLTNQSIDAAWRLSQREKDASLSQELQQEICINIAQKGDENLLLVKLLELSKAKLLSPVEHQNILESFLEKRSFSDSLPWKSFFSEFPDSELPQIHQVYSLMEYYLEAADLAATAADYRSSLQYLMMLSDKESIWRALHLAEQLQESEYLTQAHLKLAESFWQEGDYQKALNHFQEANNLERVSDCHQKLGHLASAIQLRPSIHSEWQLEIRSLMENRTKEHLSKQEFLEAVSLLKTVEKTWREKGEAENLIAEANRTEQLLYQAVKTARFAFERDLQTASKQSEVEIYKQWSELEEAAENYLEGALKAEKAHDYFAASLLFEKAGAFGQALDALNNSPETVSTIKKAELLEQGGDYFNAAIIYERLAKIERAIELYEQAEDFTKAAELLRNRIGDGKAVFSPQYLELMTKAGQIEQLAQLCNTKANESQCSPEAKALYFRRIKELAEQNLIGQKWLDLVRVELGSIEALNHNLFNQKAKAWLNQATKEVLANYSEAWGLDLGTSNSVVCLYNKTTKQPEIVEHKGRVQFPSVWAIDRTGKEIVGTEVSKLIGISPRAIVTKAKRQMGTDKKIRAGGINYRPEEISARIIAYGRQLAREYLSQKIGEKIASLASNSTKIPLPSDWINQYLEEHPPTIPLNQIVITVPAYFNDAQKQATRTAGELADVDILRLIHEPTAACLAQRIDSTKNETVLVVDLGAGTFDLSIIEIDEEICEVLEIEGDNSLGSADADELIYSYFLNQIQSTTGQNIKDNRIATTRLRQACEELKIELSSRTSWTINLPQLVANQNVELTLTRDELESLLNSWLKKIRKTCQKISRTPDRILLIGGGAIMPAVYQCIKEVFVKEANRDIDPLTAVARGAAIQAAIITGEANKILLLDAVPFSLSIKVAIQEESRKSKCDILIPKHSIIPVKETKRYTTLEDGQKSVNIEVFQGESSIPAENFKIGQFILQNIPPAKAGVPKIDVVFDINTNCLLTVTARDIGTGNQCSIRIVDSHLLTPAQAKVLKDKFYNSQIYQKKLVELEKLVSQLSLLIREVEYLDISTKQSRLQTLIEQYEAYRDDYVLTEGDNETFFEIYQNRDRAQANARLALDRWDTLQKSTYLWLDSYSALDWNSPSVGDSIERIFHEGRELSKRINEAIAVVNEIATTYRRWLHTVENLSLKPEGNPEASARHLIRLGRYSEALAQFNQLDSPLSLERVKLGLEILARLRKREAYRSLLLEYQDLLQLHHPDFNRLNLSVTAYIDSVVWIQANIQGVNVSGSGFVIDGERVATNRHVIFDSSTKQSVSPQLIKVITSKGDRQVRAICLPDNAIDDVAILELEPDKTSMTPLNLGFSELVEVGEKLITIGFPAPDIGGFEENIYCNTGLVNRIRPSQFCSERVLEVSIPVQGGISGAPIINEVGEVVGLLTFSTQRQQSISQGQINIERSFYAIPVEILRRLSNKAIEK